jgi:hypothetical protein
MPALMDQFMTPTDVALALGVSDSTVRNYWVKGWLRAETAPERSSPISQGRCRGAAPRSPAAPGALGVAVDTAEVSAPLPVQC